MTETIPHPTVGATDSTTPDNAHCTRCNYDQAVKPYRLCFECDLAMQTKHYEEIKRQRAKHQQLERWRRSAESGSR